MSLFSSPGVDAAYDRWLTTPPEGHPGECNCDDCHEEHDIRELAGDVDFDCCTDALEDLVSVGEACAAKPKEHFDLYMDGKVVELKNDEGKILSRKFVFAKPAKCLECEAEKEVGNATHA